MDQNFAGSQHGEMPPSDTEYPDEEKGIPSEDPSEDQVKLPIYPYTLKLLKIKTIEAMIWYQFYFHTIPIGPRGDR